MTKKYDWPALKAEFVEGHWLTISAFFKAKGLSSDAYTRSRAVGWLHAREKHQKLIRKRAREKLIDKEIEAKIRHFKIARSLQYRGVEHLSKLEPKTVDEARKLIASGVEIEREALGLNRKTKQIPNLTQVNVSVPKTRFDGLIENADYHQLLRMIAEIKKERERRVELKAVTN